MEDFNRQKIMYSEIVREPHFFLDNKGEFYPEATTFIITGNENLENLTFLLNSKLVTYLFRKFYAGGGLGKEGIRYKKVFLEKLPLPRIESKIYNEKQLFEIYGINNYEMNFISSQ